MHRILAFRHVSTENLGLMEQVLAADGVRGAERGHRKRIGADFHGRAHVRE
ncbi:MAG: hypothetical protein ABIZ80_19460 [Bryobacteraceae bacterium]